MLRRRVVLLCSVLVLVAVPLASARGDQRRAATGGPPIVIAVEAPLTGSQASNGRDMLRGVQLAAKQVNATGGVLGRRIEVVQADDRGDKANARSVARAVIAKGAVAVIGPYNSSVGIVNLPIYLRGKVVPFHLTSSELTRGKGVTIQPKNSQIAPVEERYIKSRGAKKVAMLVDATTNGAFTRGMASRLRTRLKADGVEVSWISIHELDAAPEGYYATKVAEALAGKPDLVYASTYYPEGAKIAQALAAAGSRQPCLMGLANVDPAFVGAAGLAASQRCAFSGVPEAAKLGSADSFVRQYRAAFGKRPGVWGVFTYDSARILFAAMQRLGTTSFAPLLRALRHVDGYHGQTGITTIDPATGYRVSLPFLRILKVDANGQFTFRR